MNANIHQITSKLGAASDCYKLDQLSDSELLASTRRLVGGSNQLFAALLAHLAEVESRGIHRARACSSLYTYCIYELRFSEDAAGRRASAAKWVKRFPALLDAVANGELHLTGLLMLGPVLTDDNHLEVLARAKFRTKKELTKLIRILDPLPQVADRIEPLGPALALAPRRPTWEQFVQSLCPPVRELAPGESPRDWADDPLTSEAIEERAAEQRLDLSPTPELPPLTTPQRYHMQFTTNQEHVRLVERAQALLSRSLLGDALGELHLQAMRLLVASLEKQKFAVTPGARKRANPSDPAARTAVAAKPPGASRANLDPNPKPDSKPEAEHPRQRGRHVPAAERRTVFMRDGGRCSYVDARGERCRETHFLEIHHLKAFALGGEHVAPNLALRCAAHNALAAEEDFGRKLIEQKRDSRHESFAAQTTPTGSDVG